MALTDLQIATLVERYIRERDRFEKLAARVLRHVTNGLRNANIRHVPTFRSKDPTSLQGKLDRDRLEHTFEDLERDFAPRLLDLAGVRILLYQREHVERTCAIIEELFDCPRDELFRANHENARGYWACHRVVALREEMVASDPALANVATAYCEIQVTTLPDHIWNELEHDIQYKKPAGEPSEAQQALLQSLRGELNAVNGTVTELVAATERQKAENLTEIATVGALHQALKKRCGTAFSGDFGGLLRLLGGVLREVTLAQLQRLPLDATDIELGIDRLAKAGITAANDDVAVVVAALWPMWGDDFRDLVSEWWGRPGPLNRAVRGLAEAAKRGTI